MPSSISPRILDEAADWLIRLGAGEADRVAFERWRSRSPEHAQAWARAEMLLAKLAAVPPGVALPTLDRSPNSGRRMVLARIGKLALLLGMLPAGGWLARQALQQQGLLGDYRAGAGERRELRLDDGTLLVLNTATAVDLRFDREARRILLRAGEILVTTGHDEPAGRPLMVVTSHGEARPLGTRFAVRQDDDATRVAVFEGRVRIAPAGGGEATAYVLESGEQASYSKNAVGPVAAADESALAWTRGMLLADDMPLADLAGELSRYRHGLVQCTDEVAGWRVSGAFPVGDAAATERSLSMLAATLPLDIRLRLGGLWVTLAARR